MRLRLVPAAALVAALGWAASSPSLPAPAPNPTPAPAAEFEARMGDDSVVKVTLAEPVLVVATKYGRLTVPAADVRKVELGFRYPEGAEAKIDRAVQDLGSPSFETREAAEKTLVGFDHLAVPAARRATHSPDPEVARRAAAVLKKLEDKLPPEKLALRDQDVVETTEFTARGRIDADQLKVRTRYFGDSALRLADVRSLRALGGTSGAAEVTVDASYARANHPEWLATAVEVAAGQTLEISATGRIEMRPTLPGRYASGPDGLTNLAALAAAAPPPVGPGMPAPPAVGIPGQLIGRVGPNGAPFVVGSSYKGKAAGSGKLQLRVGSSPYPQEPTGGYKVKVTAGGP